MVNVKAPVKPVQKRGLWPPKNGREYPVLDTDDWWKIAARFPSNNRAAGTPEENTAVVPGSIAYFGMSSGNERDIVYCLLGYI